MKAKNQKTELVGTISNESRKNINSIYKSLPGACKLFVNWNKEFSSKYKDVKAVMDSVREYSIKNFGNDKAENLRKSVFEVCRLNAQYQTLDGTICRKSRKQISEDEFVVEYHEKTQFNYNWVCTTWNRFIKGQKVEIVEITQDQEIDESEQELAEAV